MQKRHVSISFFVLFFFFFTSSLVSQTDTITVDQKGNLNLFTERIYLASKAYNTGIHMYKPDYLKLKKDSIEQYQSDSTRYKKSLPYPTLIEERPIRVAVIRKNGEQTIMKGEELNKIPIRSILSIEIIYGPLATGLYGVDGSCGIVIKLMD